MKNVDIPVSFLEWSTVEFDHNVCYTEITSVGLSAVRVHSHLKGMNTGMTMTALRKGKFYVGLYYLTILLYHL